MKRGIATSEFWLSTVATVLSLLYGSGFIIEGSRVDHVLAIVAGCLVAMGYQVSRTFVKMSANKSERGESAPDVKK